MNISHWLAGCFSGRRKAISLYRRGMIKAKNHDHPGAIADYTNMIGIPGTPANLIAMVLFNRALVHVAAGDNRKGAVDLQAVLAMNDARVNVKSMARQKLARMESRASKNKV